MPEPDQARPEANGAPIRRLAAIIHADVVGYSRLMGEDETGTHARLIACRKLMQERIDRHGGRLVGTAGDAILAEFPSVVAALEAACETQRASAEANADRPATSRLTLRIGLNLGEVIVDGDDIFGDGVNVAARVQALAEPGGIAVSGVVRDQLRSHPGVTFEDQGLQRLKNVAEPVRVHAVREAGSGDAARSRPHPHRHWLVFGAFAALLVLLLVGAALYATDRPIWHWASVPTSSPLREPSTDRAVVSGKPTIAVLPFEDRGGSAETAYFADGVTEDIIGELGHFSSLFVLSWSAVAPYKETAVAPDELRRDLDVRYVVSGTIRRADDRLRVTVQLTDAVRGVLLWSERYDERLADVFAVQDQITRQVVSALAIHLSRVEQARVFEKPTESLGAYDLVLRGRELLHRIERGANFAARAMFEAALAIDPRYADAHVGLAQTHLDDFKFGWTQWPNQAVEQAQAHAERAIEIDRRNAQAYAQRADILRFLGDFAAAERAIDRAIELNPNSAVGHAIRGGLLVYAGQPKAGREALELALRLDPHSLPAWIVNLALAYYQLGDYALVIDLFERFGGDFAEDPASHMLLAAAHGQLDQLTAAARALERLRRLSPFFDPKVFASNLADPAHGRHLLEGLHQAGWE